MQAAAHILRARPLLYAEGADAAQDRPAWVRAASGIAVVHSDAGQQLAICQDDAAFVALVDPVGGAVRALPLPAGPGGKRQFDKGRGNKMDKQDLESACCVRDADGHDVLWLLGSGSAAVREVLLEVDVRSGAVHTRSTAALCAAIRAHPAMAGAELNLEGLCVMGEDAVLLQRGNGVGGVNARIVMTLQALRACVLTQAPPTLALTPLVLPRVQGVPLTFTDACAHPSGVLFLAAAEASPNAIDDGEVVGAALGLLSVTTDDAPRCVPLLEADGAPSVRKPEGICLDPLRAGHAFVVCDLDDPSAPSALLEVRLPDFLAHS